MSLVSYTFFKKRPKVGNLQLLPLTAGRLIMLEERGNPLASGDSGDGDTDPFALYEALMVCTTTGRELAELSLCNDLDWKLEVRAFSAETEDEALNGFQKEIEKEMAAISAAQVKPVKKRGARKAGKHSAQGKR